MTAAERLETESQALVRAFAESVSRRPGWQRELAGLVGVTDTAVSFWKLGKRSAEGDALERLRSAVAQGPKPVEPKPERAPESPYGRRSRVESIRLMRLPVVQAEAHWRPSTRAECVDAPRPCPYVGCRHHLALDVSPNGSIAFFFDDPSEMSDTCSLDVADRGEHTLGEIADILGVSRERIRQVEEATIKRLGRTPIGKSLRDYEHHELGQAPGTWDVMGCM